MSAADAAALSTAAASLALAWRKAWLTPAALAGAALVGLLLWWGAGLAGVGALLFFFLTASALTRLTRGRTGRAGSAAALDEAAGGTRRSLSQVVANGGVAAAAALLGGIGLLSGAGALVAGALAAATADTWASELGRAVAGPTRLLTTWERVAPGRSGGVSAAGTGAGLAGAALLGLAWGLLAGGPAGPAVGAALAAGAAGMTLDSALGASVEGRVRWVGNDAVNVAGTLLGGLVGWALLGRG